MHPFFRLCSFSDVFAKLLFYRISNGALSVAAAAFGRYCCCGCFTIVAVRVIKYHHWYRRGGRGVVRETCNVRWGREGKKKKKGNGKKGGKTKTTKQRLNAGVRSAKDGGEGWRRTHPRANRKNNDNYSCQVCVWAYFKDIIGGECEEEGWVGDAA